MVTDARATGIASALGAVGDAVVAAAVETVRNLADVA